MDSGKCRKNWNDSLTWHLMRLIMKLLSMGQKRCCVGVTAGASRSLRVCLKTSTEKALEFGAPECSISLASLPK